MTKGEGLVALLYAIKDLINSFGIMFITGGAMILFFWIIVNFIGAKAGLGGGSGPFGGAGKINSKTIMYALFILFVIFGLYSLIALTAAVFGVNSSPSGGLLVQ